MGGVIFRQNSEEAFRRFREAGVNTDEYMGEYGQKGFFLDVETNLTGINLSRLYVQERLMPVSFAGEWLRLPGANLSVGMRRNIAGWALYVMCL